MAEEDGAAQQNSRIEMLLAEATADIRAEVERLARAGEANTERLARRLIEAMAREIANGLSSSGAGGEAAGTPGQIAAAVARAAMRGARFR